jgi:hypothetical protein
VFSMKGMFNAIEQTVLIEQIKFSKRRKWIMIKL